MSETMLDQGIAPTPDWAITLGEIDSLVEEATFTQNDSRLIDYANHARAGIFMRGVALSKLLAEWKRITVHVGIEPDDWEDHVFASTGLSYQTIRKYVDVWDTVLKGHPELLGKPMQGLLLLPAAVRERQLDDADFEEIASAPDTQAIRNIVRRARGKATSSETALVIRMGRDGILTGRRGDETENFGYLSTEPKSEVGEDAIDRLIRSAGIVRD